MSRKGIQGARQCHTDRDAISLATERISPSSGGTAAPHPQGPHAEGRSSRAQPLLLVGSRLCSMAAEGPCGVVMAGTDTVRQRHFLKGLCEERPRGSQTPAGSTAGTERLRALHTGTDSWEREDTPGPHGTVQTNGGMYTPRLYQCSDGGNPSPHTGSLTTERKSPPQPDCPTALREMSPTPLRQGDTGARRGHRIRTSYLRPLPALPPPFCRQATHPRMRGTAPHPRKGLGPAPSCVLANEAARYWPPSCVRARRGEVATSFALAPPSASERSVGSA